MRMPIHLLVLQLLPILVFLLVDALVQDPLWAIGSALIFVAFQTVLNYVRKKKFDPFILIDALVVPVMRLVVFFQISEVIHWVVFGLYFTAFKSYRDKLVPFRGIHLRIVDSEEIQHLAAGFPGKGRIQHYLPVGKHVQVFQAPHQLMGIECV